jgi:mono/diheme cytochrome c family protein
MQSSAIAVLALTGLLVQPAVAGEPSADGGAIERGRYLAQVSGCNDCHTPGYLERSGDVPEAQWLTGNQLGFQGPWGTTYPANLRRYVQELTEDQWLVRVRQPMRPPMPWFNLKAMNDNDLRALYRYIVHLGVAGEPAPAAVAPGVAVTTPYFDFVPKNTPKVARR